jgi:hypothetical protein
VIVELIHNGQWERVYASDGLSFHDYIHGLLFVRLSGVIAETGSYPTCIFGSLYVCSGCSLVAIP